MTLFEKYIENATDENNNIKAEGVEHPVHYQGKHECIEIMRALFGDEAVRGFCMCNAYKYRFRAGKKDGETTEKDIQKAEWYEDYLINMAKRKEE